MADTEFPKSGSFLFPDLDNLSSSINEPSASAQPQLDFSRSLLFQSEPSTSSSVSALSPGEPSKSVRLLNGSIIELRARKRRSVPDTFEHEPNSIIDMDKLYNRVSQRKQLKESKEQISSIKTPASTVRTDSSMLWSEKYKPKSFMQICPAGNERQYRIVMQWLQKWASVVFKTPAINDDTTDSLGRPSKKVLLVHGPSGIGKTAVVHLLAKQMGYNVEELNAANSADSLPGASSTDRASSHSNVYAALKLKTKNALTSNTITSNGRPTCLIIDEIDSASNSGDIVRLLTELVNADLANTRSESSDVKQKNKKIPFKLTRPIICIANDIYPSNTRSVGPSPMEKLRSLCELVPFHKPSAGSSYGFKISMSAQKSTKDFLYSISTREKLGLDRKDIAEIFELCDGDIRACINYLQFSCRKLDPDLHSFQPDSANKSLNMDSSLSWFALVDMIFKRDQTLSKEENFEQMLDTISYGDGKFAASDSLDKVMRGCFNRYLDVVHLQDDSYLRPAEISDWLYFYDRMSCRGGEFNAYSTLSSVKFWSLFSDINPHKFKTEESLIPNAKNLDFETFEALKQNKSVLRRLADQIPITSKVSLGGSATSAQFACHFVPYMNLVLSPAVGSAKSKSLLKAHEVKLVEKLARLIRNFGIKLESQRDLETNRTYLLYGPDWEGITLFSSIGAGLEQKRRDLNLRRQWLFPLVKAEFEESVKPNFTKRERSVSESQTKQKRPRVASSVEYFRNQYDEISNKLESPPEPVNKKAGRIWVKHHEGFSNAVRKNIGWHDLWH